MNIDQALKDMNESLPIKSNKVIDTGTIDATKVETELMKPLKDKEVKKGRLMTKEMRVKVVRLAEEWFFIRSIAGKAGVSVDTIERELVGRSDENREGNKEFALSFTRARDRWIAFHQNRLQEYAKDKKTKDWHSEKYLLTIADKEFSERKYLTEAVSNQEAKILMLIKAESLTIAQKQGKDMLKTVVNTPLQPEPISLLPFEQEDRKNKGKAKVKKGKR